MKIFDAKQFGNALKLIFTHVFISGINIAISGHLLSYIFNLNEYGNNRFNIKIPFIFNIEIKGQGVIAGFAAFSLSLIFVGCWHTDLANDIFIENLKATNNIWTASQSLATSFSLTACIFIASIKYMYLNVRLETVDENGNPEERAKRLTGKKYE